MLGKEREGERREPGKGEQERELAEEGGRHAEQIQECVPDTKGKGREGSQWGQEKSRTYSLL